MDSVRIIRKYPDLGQPQMNLDNPEIPSPLSRALKSLLSVLETAHPFPPQTSHHTSGPTPVFPPILTAHASNFLPNEITSYNALWVNRVVRFDCPRVLVNRFMPHGLQKRKTRRGLETVQPDTVTWENSEEAQLFHRLVFLNGFAPFADVLSSSTSSIEHEQQEQSSSQLTAAREVARSKVYNLRYLIPERCWGPFLPTRRNRKLEDLTMEEDLSSRGSFGLGDVLDGSTERPTSQFVNFIQDAEEDGDYVSNDAEDSDSDGEYDEDDIRLVLSNGQPPDSTFVPPKPHKVVPDYAFLSAARLLIEMNLREALVLDNSPLEISSLWNLEMNRVVDAFGWLEFVRMGGAPGFWENWTPYLDADEGQGIRSNGEEDPSFIYVKGEEDLGKGKAKAKDVEEYKGWDWAGAAGEWKRAVCWLDYRDLLLHNLTGFPSESLEETVRVFPMTIRVSGYSPPPDPDPELKSSATLLPRSALESLVYTLPVIHLEGETKGSDIDLTVMRHIKGTVRMLADGAVRWTLLSSFPGEHAAEWVTESVQVGAIGSVVGIIGMWTGAEHAATDPLGPTWAWKVG